MLLSKFVNCEKPRLSKKQEASGLLNNLRLKTL